MNSLPVSAIVLTKNEEKNIQRCLESLASLDEVLVLDSGSTDRTLELAKEFPNVKIIQTPWLGFSGTKEVGIQSARHSWILWLDADERMDEESLRQLPQVLEAVGPDVAGFKIARKTYFLGRWIRHTGWYPGSVLRLFHRERARLNGNILHEGVEPLSGFKILTLMGHIDHFSYSSLYQYFLKMNAYGRLGAEELQRKGKSFSYLKLILNPLSSFLKFYFLKNGFLDGARGFLISVGSAFSNFIKYANLWDLKHSLDNKRVMISRTDSIGDVVLTLPMAAAIKKAYPRAHVLFLGSSYTKDVVRLSDAVDEFLEWTPETSLAVLKNAKADAILHVFPKKQIAADAKQAGINLRVGTAHRFFHWWTCNKLLFFSRKKSDLHESQLNLKLLSPFAIQEDLTLQDIRQTLLDLPRKSISTSRSESEINNAGPHPFVTSDYARKFNFSDGLRRKIILHPKSKGSAREWPLAHFLALAKELTHKKYEVFISGTEEEGDLIRSDCPELLDSKVAIDITGKFKLSEFIQFISTCDALVACSTGPLHLAAMQGVHAIGLYPTMRPLHPGRWAPIGPRVTVLTPANDCQCQDKSHCTCLAQISPYQVLKNLE